MRVLCFGDSNTYGYDPRSYLGDRYGAEDRWVDLLAQKSGWEFINAGQNGREIPRREREFQSFEQFLDRSLPLDLLLVMLGNNDLLQGKHPEGVSARMEAFLRRVPMDPRQIVLLAPPPMQPGAWITRPQLLSDSVELISRYRELSQALGTRFVDPSGWNIGLTFDGVHFTGEGHRTFAEQLYPILAALE